MLVGLTLWLSLGACRGQAPTPEAPTVAPTPPNRDENALWLRRRWIHETRTDAEIRALADTLATRGITRIYPFVGPPGADGRLGWRDGETIRPYDPAVAQRFFSAFRTTGAPARVLPWTGGVSHRDIQLTNEAARAVFVAEAKHLVALGADGVHINIEPMVSFAPGYLELLAALRAEIAPGILSVAAYPPPTTLHPYEDVHWTLEFLDAVCAAADEVNVMAYDTALTDADAYAALVQEWTAAIAKTLAGKRCVWWLGVPAYDEHKPWHDPKAETIAAAIRGVQAGLPPAPPTNFKGVAVYASWTTDTDKWAAYDRDWRQRAPVAATLIDVEPAAQTQAVQ
jgi:Glycosyl hydrolases family 18